MYELSEKLQGGVVIYKPKKWLQIFAIVNGRSQVSRKTMNFHKIYVFRNVWEFFQKLIL